MTLDVALEPGCKIAQWATMLFLHVSAVDPLNVSFKGAVRCLPFAANVALVILDLAVHSGHVDAQATC